MFCTEYYYIKTLDDVMVRLTSLKHFESMGDEQAHRELEAIGGTLKACGIKWKFILDKNTDKFTAVLF